MDDFSRHKGGSATLRLKAPNPREVEIVDKEGKGIEGAEVWVMVSRWSSMTTVSRPSSAWRNALDGRSARLWTHAGTSDAKGKAVVSQPVSGGVMIRAKGKELAYSSGMKNKYTLGTGPWIKGRVLFDDDRPAAGLELALFHYARARTSRTSTRSLWFDYPPIVTKDDGSFEVAGMTAGQYFRVEFVLDAKLWKALGRKGAMPSPRVIAAFGTLKAGEHDLGTIRLNDLELARFTVRGFDGSPARDADIVLRPDEFTNSFNASMYSLRSDRRGQVAALLPRGDYHAMAFSKSHGASVTELELAKDKDAEFALQLKAFRRVRIKVSDGAGKPVVGAVIRTSGGSYSHVQRFFALVYGWNQQQIQGTTNEFGFHTASLVHWPSQSYTVRASIKVGRRTVNSGGRVSLRSDGDQEELELTVDTGK